MRSLLISFSFFFFYQSIPSEGMVYHSGSDFLTVSRTDGFVDKTMLIKRIIKGKSRILITAPRKFGKSTNLDMLKTFFSIDSSKSQIINDTFMNLNIRKHNTSFFNEHFSKYPVLYVTFKTGVTKSYQDALNDYATAIHEAYLEHKYLQFSKMLSEDDKGLCKTWCGGMSFLKMDTRVIKLGLKSLVRILKEHHGKRVIVLIDEYDCAINNALFQLKDNSEFFDIVSITSHILSTLIKDTDKDVHKAVVTGISYISSAGMSEINNLEKFYFLDDHQFVEFYGFTENEIDSLYAKGDFVKFSKQRELVKQFYNGYVCKRGRHVYHTYSFLRFLETGKIINHILDIGGYVSNIIQMVKYPEMGKIFNSLLSNKSVNVEMQYSIDIGQVLQLKTELLHSNTADKYQDTRIPVFLLLELGILTYDINLNDTNSGYKVKIPNLQIYEIVFNKLKEHLSIKCNSSLISNTYSLLQSELIQKLKDKAIQLVCMQFLHALVKTVSKHIGIK